MKVITAWIVMGLLAVTLAGCGSEKDDAAAKIDGQQFLLSDEPAGAKGVREVRETSKDDDEVVVVGRIGGRMAPFVEGQAAFMIVDPVMKPCNELDDDGCKTPWDY